MEVAVLQALEWRGGAATAPHFLDRLLHVANVGRDAAGQLQDPTTAHAARNTANSLIMTALLGAPAGLKGSGRLTVAGSHHLATIPE